jgi:hypothetical protein
MALRRLASICRNEVMGWRAPRYFVIKRSFFGPGCRIRPAETGLFHSIRGLAVARWSA